MTTFARGLAALVLAVAGILTMTVPAQAVGEITITGQITTPDGAPAAGARVRLMQQGTLYTWLTGAETTTDADGHYAIHMDFDAWYDACVAAGSPDCRYERPSAYSFFIVSEKTGFTGAFSGRLRSDVAEMQLDQQLKPPTATIAGTVRTPAGTRLPGTTVTLGLQGRGLVATKVSDQSGNYSFEVEPVDSISCEFDKYGCDYQLGFAHPDFETDRAVEFIRPLAGQTSTVNFTFDRPASAPPLAPTNVTAEAVQQDGALRASVSYTPVAGVPTYVAYCEREDGEDQYNAATYSSESPLIVGTLIPGQAYRCRVKSSNSAGETMSAWTALFIAAGPAPTATNVTMRQIAKKSAEVSFRDSSAHPSTSTAVVRCRSADRKIDVTVTGTTSPVRVDRLRPGQTYQCYVTITNGGVTGERSAPNRSYYMHRSFK